jgi:predicted nucleic acid-binding Zn ribbon protein
MSDAPLTVCPSCGKQTFNKLISAAGFQLKGSGWYATDFKGGGKPAAKDGDKPKDDSKAKDETKPKDEAKPKDEPKAAASSGAVAGTT